MSDLNANQLVGYNLGRIRKARGLSQAEAAGLLAPHLGVRWSNTVLSLAERSWCGKRVRHFSAVELLAFSLTFGVPIAYFFLPVKGEKPPAVLADTTNPAYVLRVGELA